LNNPDLSSFESWNFINNVAEHFGGGIGIQQLNTSVITADSLLNCSRFLYDNNQAALETNFQHLGVDSMLFRNLLMPFI
jgi:hypothetical protein